jgi:hypothetical protein
MKEVLAVVVADGAVAGFCVSVSVGGGTGGVVG